VLIYLTEVSSHKPHNPKFSEKGVLPVHISYGVLTTDLEGTLFKVKAAVSRE
jgi:hypothetical protein